MSFDKLNASEPRDSWSDHDILLWNAFKIKSLDDKFGNHLKHVQWGLGLTFTAIVAAVLTLVSVVLSLP